MEFKNPFLFCYFYFDTLTHCFCENVNIQTSFVSVYCAMRNIHKSNSGENGVLNF